jgi:glycosyltransferase involved in cell wall biosynthesis
MPTQELQMTSNQAERGSGARAEQTRTVLFVTHTPGYGGSEKHVFELLSRINDPSVRAVILCAETDPYTECLSQAGNMSVSVRREFRLKAESHRASLPFPKFSFAQLWRWFRVFRETKPEVVVFVYGTLSQIPWFASLAARLAGARRLILIQHLIPPPVPPEEGGKSFRSALRGLAGRRARLLQCLRVPPYLSEKVICVSNAVRDSLVRDYRFPPNKTVTIHNGVSVTDYSPSQSGGSAIRSKLGIGSEEFVLVCAARLSHEKGIDILLDAMSMLLEENIRCKCIIVGEGYMEETLLDQMRKLGLTKNVFMEGFHEDVRPYFHAADAFILTSYKEGLPFAVLEAMACGLPCIVTNVGGNAEAIANNVNGLVVNAGSAKEVAEAVTYLQSHAQEREGMSRVGRTRAREEFDIEVRMAEMKQAILE